MPVHVYPSFDDTHCTEGLQCWCNPRVQYIDPDTGLPWAGDGPLITHNAPEGYDASPVKKAMYHIFPIHDDTHQLNVAGKCWCRTRHEPINLRTREEYPDYCIAHHQGPEGYPCLEEDWADENWAFAGIR